MWLYSRDCRRTVRVRNEDGEDVGMPVLPFPLEVTTITLSGVNSTFVAVVGVIAVLALVMAMVFRREVLAASDGTTKMQVIARAVQEGASAYLARQFRTLSVFAVAAFFLLLLLPVHASEEYEGKTYYFCADECKKRFDAEPAKHVQAR